MPAGMQAALAEQVFGAVVSAARQTLAEQLMSVMEGNAAAVQTLSELNGITAPSPEVFRVWDNDKGQYVYAPRYVWNGTKWLEVGGNTVPSWKHPFLWTGV